MPWNAISYVSSGLTLAAFLAACVVWYLKSSLDQRRRLIQSAKPEHRADLIHSTLEFFHVDTTNLTRQQQYEIALAQINERARRFAIGVSFVAFVALLAATLSAYALWRSHDGDLAPRPTSPEQADAAPAPGKNQPITNIGAISGKCAVVAAAGSRVTNNCGDVYGLSEKDAQALMDRIEGARKDVIALAGDVSRWTGRKDVDAEGFFQSRLAQAQARSTPEERRAAIDRLIGEVVNLRKEATASREGAGVVADRINRPQQSAAISTNFQTTAGPRVSDPSCASDSTEPVHDLHITALPFAGVMSNPSGAIFALKIEESLFPSRNGEIEFNRQSGNNASKILSPSNCRGRVDEDTSECAMKLSGDGTIPFSLDGPVVGGLSGKCFRRGPGKSLFINIHQVCPMVPCSESVVVRVR